MDGKTLAKAMLIWLGIVPLAILNGILREALLGSLLGNAALPLSGVLLCGLILLWSLWRIPRLGVQPDRVYRQIGLLWLAATLLFETGMGLADGSSLTELLAAYDLRTGNLWLLVVLTTGCAPWIAAHLRQTRDTTR